MERIKINLLNDLRMEGKFYLKKNPRSQRRTLLYHYATYKEKYPFKHKKYSKNKKVPKLSDHFYAYRKELSYGNRDFTYLSPYYGYMLNHFGNLAYMSCSVGCNINDKMVKNHLHFNKHKLKLIDSLVEEKELKDNLFRNVAMDYLLESS